MELVIVLRTEVANQQQGEQIFETVKRRLEDRPDITVTGHVTNHFPESEVPE